MAKEIGFQDGDQMLTIDGEALENVMDVNRHLFLRSPQVLLKFVAKGVKTSIAIPEDMGTQMFERGDLFPLMPVQKHLY